MKFDYSKLLGKMKECGLTQSEFAKIIGISETTLSLKLSNKAVFKQNEIKLCSDCLGLSANDIGHYFFTPLVQKN